MLSIALLVELCSDVGGQASAVERLGNFSSNLSPLSLSQDGSLDLWMYVGRSWI